MIKKTIYPNIDMEKTGYRIKRLLETAGYKPRMIQEYLHLSCLQPIYRWYKGLILPSVDHLFMLSELLNIHMEDFIVKKSDIVEIYDIEENSILEREKRFVPYINLYSKLVS